MLILHALQSLAGRADRELRRAQFAREPVALDLIAAHLACDVPDLRLDGLQLGLGLLPIRGRRGRSALHTSAISAAPSPARHSGMSAAPRSKRGGAA